MTVKIVNEVPDKSVVKQFICKNCGVTIEYTPSDIRWQNESYYDGSSDTCGYINCPKCHKATMVGQR